MYIAWINNEIADKKSLPEPQSLQEVQELLRLLEMKWIKQAVLQAVPSTQSEQQISDATER